MSINNPLNIQPEDILNFWFGDESPTSIKEKSQIWFGRNEEIDKEITLKFQTSLEDAKKGKLDHWKETPKGCLALIILLDQFSRNIYREKFQSFEADILTPKILEYVLEKKWDKHFESFHKSFLYMPLMHSEDLNVQNRSVEIFEELEKENKEEGQLKWAKHHRDIIKEFGRFPHRNSILTRESTSAEIEWLKTNKW